MLGCGAIGVVKWESKFDLTAARAHILVYLGRRVRVAGRGAARITAII